MNEDEDLLQVICMAFVGLIGGLAILALFVGVVAWLWQTL